YITAQAWCAGARRRGPPRRTRLRQQATIVCASMDISVLGPLQVTIAGRDVPIPAKQAVLLAILAIQPNREVSTDRLIEALWGEDAPSASARTLQTHVFQL